MGPENVGQTLIDGEPVPALIDNGAQVNTVTPAFVKKCGLVVGSITDLNKHRGWIPVSCSGGYYTEPIGYVMVWVQFPGIPSYDENQVALVIRDGSEFSQRVPVIIGTPMIDRVVWALGTGRVIIPVLTANITPEGKPTPELIKKLDEQDPESAPPKLSIKERQRLLMQLLKQEGRLDELAQWTLELARKFEQMLMEYHDIFSLDKNEIGCTDAAEHIIELLDEEPFKEKFWQIALPLLDEVREHLQEMLDGGAIHPLQSPWCNAVVLVWKKDGGLQFGIDFR